VHFFEGDVDQERLARIEYPCGQVQHYEGPQDQEHHVRTEFASKHAPSYCRYAVIHEGPRDEERKVRLEMYERDLHIGADRVRETTHYEGNKGEEHKVRSENHGIYMEDFDCYMGHEVRHYEGPKGEEHLVLLVKPYRECREDDIGQKKEHYTGPKDEERLTKIEFPSGIENHYDNDPTDRPYKRVYPNGDECYYTYPAVWYGGYPGLEERWVYATPPAVA
jgi:hypothetical protein